MSEDAGAAGTAAGASTPEGQPDTTPQGGAGAAGGQDDGGDRSPEDMLAEAVNGGDSDGEDPAKQLAKAQAEAKKWRDLSRKNEAAAKANTEAARRLAEIEDRDKTELQRQTDRAIKAEQAAAEHQALYHRTIAAAQHGIPADLLDMVSGSTEEECAASAEALASAINTAAEAKFQELAAARAGAATAPAVTAQLGRPGTTRPVESLRPGAQPASEPDLSRPDDWLRHAAGR